MGLLTRSHLSKSTVRGLVSVLLLWLSHNGIAAAECGAGLPGSSLANDARHLMAQTHARAGCAREPARESVHETASEPSMRSWDRPEVAIRAIAPPAAMAPTPNTAAPHSWTSWSAQSAMSAATIANQHSQDAQYQSPVERSMNEVHWADSHDWIHNPPEWIKEVKNYRKQGMPIIHLMESKQTLIAIGVSNHGKPGLYFTRKLPF